MIKNTTVDSHLTRQIDPAIAPQTWPKYFAPNPDEERKDHFIRHNGVVCAGSHLIIDLWGAKGLDCLEKLEQALRDCVIRAGATLLHIHLHHFTPNGGISGVAVLAESHITVHTWPEYEYAAFDVFMCGDAKPEAAVAVLKETFHPLRTKVVEQLRGVIDNA